MLRRGLPGVLSDDRWRYAAQVHDAGLDCLDQAIDLFFRVLWPQREAHAGAGFLRRQAHGEKNVRRLDGAARTGRTAGYRVTAQIERDHDCLTLDAVETDIGGVREAVID